VAVAGVELGVVELGVVELGVVAVWVVALGVVAVCAAALAEVVLDVVVVAPTGVPVEVELVAVGLEVVADVLGLGAAAAAAASVTTEPFVVEADRKDVAFGVLISASARPTSIPPPTERNPTAVGGGITIPIRAASVSTRCSSASEVTVARSCWFCIESADPRWIARPMLAPNLRTSTCIATIPASITPSSGIHARPRTSRSSSA